MTTLTMTALVLQAISVKRKNMQGHQGIAARIIARKVALLVFILWDKWRIHHQQPATDALVSLGGGQCRQDSNG